MKIQVQLETQLRLLAGTSETTVHLNSDGTLLDVLKLIAQLYGAEMEQRILKDPENSQAGLLLFVNEKPVAQETAGVCRLQDGDIVLLYPPISGG